MNTKFDTIKKIIYGGIISIVSLMLLSTYFDYRHKKELLESQLNALESSIKSEYKKRLKESVNNTIVFIDTFYEQLLAQQKKTASGATTLSEPNHQRFLSAVKKYFYNNINDKTRYLWVNKVLDFRGGDGYAVRLIHPNLKATEGMLLSTKMEDIKGNTPFLEELEGVKRGGEIYFTYYFKKLDSDEVTEKLSYAKLYDRLNWIVATGIPIDDLGRIIEQQKAEHEAVFFRNMVKSLAIKTVIILIVVLLLIKLRKQVERTLEKLRATNKSLQNAQAVAHFGSWELDLKTNQLHWSDEVYRILGLEPHSVEATYESFLSFIHPDDREAVTRAYTRSLEEKESYIIQHRIIGQDGAIRYVEEHGRHEFDQNGTPVRTIGTVYDITTVQDAKNKLEHFNRELQEEVKKEVAERLRIEEEKLKQEHLLAQQTKMAEMGEMLSVILHQWKQPLNAISLIAQELDGVNEDYFDEPNIELQEIENGIMKQVFFMSDTMTYFRKFFSPNACDEKFLACEAIEEVRAMFSGAFAKRNIIINIAEYEGCYIYGKQNEFSHVILNLFNNAKDALVANEVEEKRIDVTFASSETQYTIRIRDNAGGIPEELLPERLFEPYVTTKGEKGTGIGLQICKMIIERNLKGRLWVHNVEGGAEFVIELPVYRDSGEEKPALSL